MMRRLFTLLAACAMLATAATTYGQGGTTSTLSGVVIDSAGGVVPGADVAVKHAATGVTLSAVSNSEGAFSFPALNPGTYIVTVSLQGFKSVVISDVVLTSGAGANVRATLEVGGIEEQVLVSSASEIVQTQSSTISTTVTTNQIMKLPMASRSALDAVIGLPGVSTPGGSRQSTINGLPQSTINITLDGVNIQDNNNRSTDGFFAIVSPRLDAIEEVTVTAASQGADAAGQGAAQIKFVTRSGTNLFTGSGYHYYRNDKYIENTWFNILNGVAKPLLVQHQAGFRVGGPIRIPALFDGRNKAFFFVNYEEVRQPSDTTRNRIVLNTAAQQGSYSYTAGGSTTTVNLLQLAAANGHISTADPIVAKVLSDIRSAVSGGSLTATDPNLQRFSYNLSTTSLRRFPTARVDYNLTDKHRFSTAFNYQYFTDTPDTLNNFDSSFPGFPVAAGQSSKRMAFTNTMRSTLRQSLVNEARVGYSWAPVSFFAELNEGMYTGSVANTGGYHLAFPAVGTQLTNAGAAPAPQSRNATSLLVEDTLTWLKGSHSITMGASWNQFDVWAKNSNLVPRVSFGSGTGLVQGDPAQAMFNAANFPGASADNLTAAQNLYALMVGRINQIAADARIDEATGEYKLMGVGTQRGRLLETGFFVQDAWRLRPSFTVNAGLRYELQLPFSALNDSYSTATMADLCGISGVNSQGQCNIFDPNARGGKRPEFINLSQGVKAYNTDANNLAPSVGFAWTPAADSGFLSRITGRDGDTVIRGGFTRAFSRNGLGDFTGTFNANPGVVFNADRTLGGNNLGPLPVLFRNSGSTAPGVFPTKPVYPLTDAINQDVRIFDPNIQTPWADSWQIGLQRSISRNMAIEARYVGTRSGDLWQQVNYNEINIFENGFVNEFRLAQGNLQANIAAGRGGNFRYFGPGTGTSPLPIMVAHFAGLGGSAASDAANYSSANFASNTFLNRMVKYNPNPFGFAQDLYGNAAIRTNAAAAGLPANFFLVNPDLQGGAILQQNVNKTKFHSMQLELRRRLSEGVQFQTSYVFGRAMESQFETLRRDVFMRRDTGSPGDITHSFKGNIVYDLPFGQGRRFGGNANGVVDRLIGGWTVGVITRFQSGQLVNFGNVRLNGMTAEEFGSLFELRIDRPAKKVWMLPADVIAETVKAFSLSATSATGYGTAGAPTGRFLSPANGPDCIEVDAPDGANNPGGGYGDCGTRSLVVTGPMFRQTDISIAKRVRVVGRVNAEFRLEALNAFNQVNFVPVGIPSGNNPISTVGNWEVTGLTGGNTTRVLQFVSRINW